MIISAVFILIASVVLSIFIVRKINVLPVITKLLGTLLVDFTIIEYVSKLSMYPWINKLEMDIFGVFARMNLAIPDIVLIMNLGVALILMSSVLLLNTHLEHKRWTIMLCIPIVAFFVLNHPQICERLYVTMYRNGGIAATEFAVRVYRYINCALIGTYALLPYIWQTAKCFRTKLWNKRRNYIFSMFTMFMMDLLIYAEFVFGNMSNYFILKLDLIKYPSQIIKIDNNFTSMVYTVVIIAAVMYILIRVKPFGTLRKDTNDVVATESILQTVSMIMHIYKNAFVAIEMFADSSNRAFLGDSEKRMEKIKAIAVENEKRIKETIDVLNVTGNIGLIKQDVSLTDVIRDAMNNARTDDSVRYVTNIEGEYMIFADEYNIRETFICLLNNAYESFKDEDEDKLITVNVYDDDGDVCVEIIDNGCGIKNKRDIFKPLYSSKNGTSNFGVGLTFAKKIIEAHDGIINIKSKENKGTVVQVIFKGYVERVNLKGLGEIVCQKLK